MLNSGAINFLGLRQSKTNFSGDSYKTEQRKEKESFKEIFDSKVAYREDKSKHGRRTEREIKNETKKDTRVTDDKQITEANMENDEYSTTKVNQKEEEKNDSIKENIKNDKSSEEDKNVTEKNITINTNLATIENLYTLLSNLKETLNQEISLEGKASEHYLNEINDLTSKLEKLLEKMTLIDEKQYVEKLIPIIEELEQNFNKLFNSQEFMEKNDSIEQVKNILDTLVSNMDNKKYNEIHKNNKGDKRTIYFKTKNILDESNKNMETNEFINKKVEKEGEDTKIILKENDFTEVKRVDGNNKELNNLNIDLESQIIQNGDIKESKNFSNNSLFEKIYMNKSDKNNIIEQIIEKAKVIITDNKSEIKIKLKPEILGHLSLKVAVEKGIVTAKAIVENYEVKQLIESNLTQLKDSLEEQGIKVQNFDVYVGKDSDSNSRQYFAHKRNGQANKIKKLKVDLYSVEQGYEKLNGNTRNLYAINNASIDIIA